LVTALGIVYPKYWLLFAKEVF